MIITNESQLRWDLSASHRLKLIKREPRNSVLSFTENLIYHLVISDNQGVPKIKEVARGVKSSGGAQRTESTELVTIEDLSASPQL